MVFSRQAINGCVAGIVAVIIVFSFCVLSPQQYEMWVPQPALLRFASKQQTSTTTPSPQSATSPQQAPWLLAILTSAKSQTRRNIIRQTWQSLFPHPNYEFRFVLGNWSSIWDPLMIAENNTYGDIWCMDEFMAENDINANTVKPIEFLKYMVRWQGQRVGRYKYVSKVDDDVFLNLPTFYEEFMAPRLEGEMDSNRTLIGRVHRNGRPYDYTSGRFYTMSWDLLELYVRLYTDNPIWDDAEDVLTGLIPYANNQSINLIAVETERTGPPEQERMFDVGDVLVTNRTLLVHYLKHDETFLRVASLFNESGYNGKQIDGITNFNAKVQDLDDRARSWDNGFKEKVDEKKKKLKEQYEAQWAQERQQSHSADMEHAEAIEHPHNDLP